MQVDGPLECQFYANLAKMEAHFCSMEQVAQTYLNIWLARIFVDTLCP